MKQILRQYQVDQVLRKKFYQWYRFKESRGQGRTKADILRQKQRVKWFYAWVHSYNLVNSDCQQISPRPATRHNMPYVVEEQIGHSKQKHLRDQVSPKLNTFYKNMVLFDQRWKQQTALDSLGLMLRQKKRLRQKYDQIIEQRIVRLFQVTLDKWKQQSQTRMRQYRASHLLGQFCQQRVQSIYFLRMKSVNHRSIGTANQVYQMNYLRTHQSKQNVFAALRRHVFSSRELRNKSALIQYNRAGQSKRELFGSLTAAFYSRMRVQSSLNTLEAFRRKT